MVDVSRGDCMSADTPVNATFEAISLFKGVAPERREELDLFWVQYAPHFQLIEDSGVDGPFVFEGGLYRYVRFNHRVLRLFWLAAFIAWEGYTSLQRSVSGGGTRTRLPEMIQIFDNIAAADDPTVVAFPPGVPPPGVLPPIDGGPEVRVAAELAIFAAGWGFLHELRHIKHQQDSTGAAVDASSVEKRKEELSCDEFATAFLLEKVHLYSDEAGTNIELVREKRKLGIYFGLFAVALLSRKNWDETESHPSLQNRMDSVVGLMKTSGFETSDVIAYAAFAALRPYWPIANFPSPLARNLATEVVNKVDSCE